MLTESCYAIFGGYPWETSYFLKENLEAMNMGKGEVGEETGKRRGSRNFC